MIWNAIEQDKVVDIKSPFDIELEVIDSESNEVVASSSVTINSNEGFYEVEYDLEEGFMKYFQFAFGFSFALFIHVKIIKVCMETANSAGKLLGIDRLIMYLLKKLKCMGSL